MRSNRFVTSFIIEVNKVKSRGGGAVSRSPEYCTTVNCVCIMHSMQCTILRTVVGIQLRVMNFFLLPGTYADTPTGTCTSIILEFENAIPIKRKKCI